MKPDTDAVRRAIDYERPHQSRWLAGKLVESLGIIDAQAEENTRLREALEHIANDKETPSQPWIEYLHLKGVAQAALKGTG